jgi:hypothetical protein
MLTLVFANDQASPLGMGRQVNEWLDDGGVVLAREFSSGDLHCIDWLGLGVFGFKAGSRKVRVWPQPDACHEAVVEAFSRTLQPLILQVLGWQALHAGAAVWHTGVLAFCGNKGSGKSTLAFAMRQAGWQQFADDALVLRLDGDRVMACALPFTPRLRPASRAHFGNGHLLPGRETHLAEVPLVAVFLLKQDFDLVRPRVTLIQKARAFSELLAHAYCFDATDLTHTRQLVEDYLRVTACVPTFTLEYQPNFQYLPQLTRAVVDAVTTIDPSADGASELEHAALVP